MKTTSKTEVVSELDSIDNAVVKQATALLKTQSDNVSLQTQTKLQQAREKAVDLIAHRERAKLVGHTGSNSLHWAGGMAPYLRQPKTLLIALLVVLVTLFSVQQLSVHNKLENSDALLLAADLPPEAFADKGFNTWVELATR